ncbi:hypothetical protein ACIGXM_22455 [Kitasatospora sp. NPDC052896]|uniref:hypothetical protein n=1 Tax=Kitasatospora sp. NPDC052896 TaxID=3364061 RepID=UPI0037C728E3
MINVDIQVFARRRWSEAVLDGLAWPRVEGAACRAATTAEPVRVRVCAVPVHDGRCA